MIDHMWLQNLAAYSLQVAALILAGAALVYVFRLKAPTVLLAFWQALLAVCLLLPLIQPWRTPQPAAPALTSTTVLTSAPILPDSGVVWPVSASLPARPMPFPTYETIVVILGAGVGLRFVWLAIGMVRLRRYRNKSRRLAVLPEVIREIQWQVGVSPEIFLSKEIDTPVTYGLHKPAVLFPESFIKMEANLQRPIACHELLHVQRRDWVYIVVEEILRSVFWFHPAVRWALGRIHLSREQVVDREVLRVTHERGHYLESLLHIASLRGRPAAVPAPLLLKERHLVQRVALMLKESKMTRSRLILSLVSIAALLLWTGTFAAGVFPLTGSPRVESMAPAPPAAAPIVMTNAPEPLKKQQQEPIRVGNEVQASKLIYKVLPVYPELAKRARVEGVVTLQVTTNEDGTVADIKILRAHPLLSQPAIDAVKQWRYSPTLLNGVPVPVQAYVDVEFKLSDTSAGTEQPPLSVGIIGGNPAGVTSGAVAGAILSGSSPQSTNPAPPLPRRVEPMRIGGTVLESRILYKVDPVYPQLAKDARVEAVVILEANVDEQGNVSGVRVLQSHPLLEQAAIDAVKQWRYQPTLLNGQPVPVVGTVTVEFRLTPALRASLDSSGNLRDPQGQPISLQQLKDAKGDILITADPQVPFAVIESALRYLQYQGIQNIRLSSTDYVFQAGRLFYTGPTISYRASAMQASSTNPSIQAPVLDIDMNRLASMVNTPAYVSSNDTFYVAMISCTLFVSETGEIVDVQGGLSNQPDLVNALRQTHVTAPGKKDGMPVPTAVRVSIMVR